MALQNQYLELTTDLFNDVQKKKITIEVARDMIRAELNITDRVSFPLKGYEGTDIFALYRAMLHDEKIYPNPDSFIPDRFLDENGKIDPNVLNPDVVSFGFGRRYVIFTHKNMIIDTMTP